MSNKDKKTYGFGGQKPRTDGMTEFNNNENGNTSIIASEQEKSKSKSKK
ncbi:MAG: hypothetical protein GQ576_04990 [Methanococcoides sp.]|jgi:hypothetical protein|uniref:Uncharacterized protein n=1 Tax=Methanococcoides seepicolus TaxID=2828780 RepID=A0A9E4ZH13_9EURY|nr:hypothetical protein [Methanococcoides seepicolus]NOQ48478.1 hypothetical protein [Methanococcoides sp.]